MATTKQSFDTVIAESQYVFDDRALQLAERFFSVPDTSLLKVGTFGYTTSLMSHIMRDSTFHKNMLHNEFFLTSANLNSTLYNWSKVLDYNIELATPSTLPILIKLNLNQLQKIASPSLTNGNILEYTISKNTTFDVGGYSFLLPYDIKISIIKNTMGQFSVSSIYDFNQFTFKPVTIKTPYLKTTLVSEAGVMYVALSASVYQLQRKEWIYSMTSNDILDIGIIEQNYGGNIVTFNAMYNDNSTTTNYYRPLEMIFNEVYKAKTDAYAYYTYVGDDTLRLYFSNRPSEFRPAFNSKLKIEVFVTAAEQGNFNYNGNINIRDVGIESIDYLCVPMTNSATGGSSIKSFRDTKIELMQRLRTRDSITTTYDLQTYFDKIKKENFTTKSDFKVVKLRDDIIRRQFSMYILSRNPNNELIPTNTVMIDLDMDEITELNYSLPAGTLVLYDRIENRYRLLRESELPEVYLNSQESYLYCIPFLVNLDFKEFPKANIYFTNYSKTIEVSYNYLNLNTPYEIVVNSFNIYRNPLYDIDNFNISVYINTNSIDVNNIKVRGVLYKGKEEIGYTDLIRVEGTSEFKVSVSSPDEFDKDGNYIIRDTFRDIETNQIISEILLNGEYRLEFGFLLKTSNSQAKEGIFAKMNNIKEYVLVSILESNEGITFAEDLTDVMYCQVNYNNTNGKISLNSLPVVGALAYLNQEENENIMNDIYSSIQIAKQVSKNLENNTSVDVKLFNTYGKSRYFNIDTIDLTLKMVISLNIFTNKILENTIKEFIVEFIESCNITAEKRFSFSNLIRLLESQFSEIKYIKYVTTNGGNIQSVQQIKYLDSGLDDLPIDYVPEFLNVKKTLPTGTNAKWYDSVIEIIYEN